MAIPQPIDVMGPTHRASLIQSLAQNAASNVMRRQHLQALVQNAASTGAGPAATAFGTPLQNVLRQNAPGGFKSTLMRLAGNNPANLARLLNQAGPGASQLGNGFTNPAGGGLDFGHLPVPPAATPPGNSLGNVPPPPPPAPPPPPPQTPSMSAPMVTAPTPTSPDTAATAPVQSGAPVNFQSAPSTPPTASYTPAPDPYQALAYSNLYGGSASGSSTADSGASPDQVQVPVGAPTTPDLPPPGTALINLGNGIYYDPATDAIHAAPRR